MPEDTAPLSPGDVSLYRHSLAALQIVDADLSGASGSAAAIP